MANTIVIEGDEEVINELKHRFPNELRNGMEAAGQESAETILDQEGLRNYPPEGPGNQPPLPYYIRGRGMQYASGNKGNSERYGSQWHTEASGYDTTVGNTASYAKYLGGEEQAEHMARLKWKKLFDVADGMRGELVLIYTKWIEWAKTKAGL